MYEQNNIFKTKDLALASYLLASDKVSLLGTDKNGREVHFHFSPGYLAEELVDQYWRLQAPAIQPKILFSAQRDIKDMIFGG